MKHGIAKEILETFSSQIQKSGEQKGFYCYPWSGARRLSKHLLECTGSINILLHISISTKQRYDFWWGIGENRLDELQKFRHKWAIVLLHGTQESGYILTSKSVAYSKPNWSSQDNGSYKSYKVHDNLKEIQQAISFQTFDEFMNAVQKIVTAT